MDSTLVGVLIGSGATAISTWLVAWWQHKTEVSKAELEHQNTIKRLEMEHRNTITKFEFERRTQILTECAELCYRNAADLTEFFTVMRAANRKRNTPNWQGMLDLVGPVSERALRSTFDLVACESKLVLLGEKSCAEKMHKYINVMGEVEMDLDKLQDETVYQASYKKLNVLLDVRGEFLEEIEKAFQRHAA